MVEPAFVDCSNNAVYPQMFNGSEVSGAAAAVDLDGDNSVGSSEDGDGDDVYDSIDDAVDSANLSDGGVAQLLVPGIYRENIGIDQSLTLRAPAGTDVTIEGGDTGMEACSAPSLTTGFDIDIGSGDVVVLENLTIRGFTVGIDLTGSTSGGTLIIKNCRFEDNTQAIQDDGNGPEIRVFDSFFVGGSYGIRDPNGLTVVDTSFTEHSQNAVEGDVAKDWRFVRSTVSGCGGIGLSAQGAQTGTHEVELIDSQVVGNGGSGVDIDGLKVTFLASRSTFSWNAGDGVHLEARTGSRFALTDCTLDGNTSDGLFVENTLGCTSPSNLVSGVVKGSRLSANDGDGIEFGGTGSGCTLPNVVAPVELGLLDSALVANGTFGVRQSTSSSSLDCQLGLNVLSYNSSGAESGTGGVCTLTGTSQNQSN